MPKLYIMCGVGFSGKSTLAKKIADHTGAILVSQDQMYFDKEKELNLDQDSDQHWRLLLDMCKGTIKENLSKGRSVVFDNINTKYEHREEIRQVAKELGVETAVIFLDTSIEIQKERQESNRLSGERHDVKQEYLDQAIAELEIPIEKENVVVFKPDTDINMFLSGLK